MTAPLMEARAIEKRFEKRLDLAGRFAARLGAQVQDEIVHALDKVNLTINPGEVLGLVGESGCGKSTLGRIIAGIMAPSAGQVMWKGIDRASLSGERAKQAKLAVQMVFQDPASSLNPRMNIADIIGEAPLVHGIISRAELDSYLESLLADVGLDPAMKRRFPHQFSGGQRQRIAIARALAVKPEFIVADEAVAALDVSIRAQIINLFAELRARRQLTYLFISHDLGIVEFIADRVAVMYLGRIVESAATNDIYARPNHPYTQALLQGAPRIEDRKRAFQAISGEIPSPLNPPSGCHFHPRCPAASARCAQDIPRLREVASGHMSACHLNDG